MEAAVGCARSFEESTEERGISSAKGKGSSHYRARSRLRGAFGALRLCGATLVAPCGPPHSMHLAQRGEAGSSAKACDSATVVLEQRGFTPSQSEPTDYLIAARAHVALSCRSVISHSDCQCWPLRFSALRCLSNGLMASQSVSSNRESYTTSCNISSGCTPLNLYRARTPLLRRSL
jgi:hypothetical protein